MRNVKSKGFKTAYVWFSMRGKLEYFDISRRGRPRRRHEEMLVGILRGRTRPGQVSGFRRLKCQILHEIAGDHPHEHKGKPADDNKARR